MKPPGLWYFVTEALANEYNGCTERRTDLCNTYIYIYCGARVGSLRVF